jgi:hypothetical protein
MLFGFKTAPSTFRRNIKSVLEPLLGQGVEVYMDNSLIPTENCKDHVELVMKTLETLGKE